MDTLVRRTEISVLRVRADMQRGGPPAAFAALEAKLPTLQGRRFYGTFRGTPEGEEYLACVERLPSDDPSAMELETGSVPGGPYVRRKLQGSLGELIPELPRHFAEMVAATAADPDRPSVEFYRSERELHLLLPVRAPG
jgi:hypothetical protein